MNKLYLLLGVGILFRTGVSAQAYLARSDKGRTVQVAAAIRLPFNPDQVENALRSYLSQKGYNFTQSHGFLLFRGVPLDNSGKAGNDLYFATSMPDRKVKDNTVLTLIPAKRNQDIGSGAFVDSSMLDHSREFLDSLAPYVSTYGIGVQVKDRQDALRKAQKKLDGMRSDSAGYENRLRGLQSDLDQNKGDQVKASSDLQTYIGADSEKKHKYQKRVNSLIEKQSSLEKKMRTAGFDLTDKKSEIASQQKTIDELQRGLDATKQRQN